MKDIDNIINSLIDAFKQIREQALKVPEEPILDPQPEPEPIPSEPDPTEVQVVYAGMPRVFRAVRPREILD